MSPTESIVNISGNLAEGLTEEYGIVANGALKKKILLKKLLSAENFRDL
jgi:hypothetical protein